MVLAIDASRANKKERTGVEWYSYFLIEEFKKIVPADTRVVLYAQDELRADLLPLPQNWEIKILRWPFRFWTIFRLSAEILFHKPDIFFSPANILPFFAPKKTFTTIHDIGFKRFPKCYSAVERCLQDWATGRAIKKSNTIFVPSEFTKKELVGLYGADAKKIMVTPLGHTATTNTTVAKTADAVLQKYKIKKPYFLFIGRKDAKKNIDGIVEAFKMFYQKNHYHSLVLAGPCQPDIQISKYSNIFDLDWINSEEKQKLLQNCEALLFPSLYEGFGLPILEAFSAECPVITSNRAPMPEIAGNAAIIVDPETTEEIAIAMENVKNPELKARLILEGKKQLGFFSWEKCAKNTIEEILAKKENGGGK